MTDIAANRPEDEPNHASAAQGERRRRFCERYIERMLDAVDDRAGWRGRGPEPHVREKLWHCLPLLDAGGRAAERANRIIESVETRRCHFSPMTSLQLLLKYPDRLTAAAGRKLTDYIRSSLPEAADPSIRFPMYNDNFAAMAAFTLLAAGERFGDEAAFAAGMDKLRQLADVFARCGTVMEFGSPTYTPITTHALAEIVNSVRDAEANRLVGQCEARMWAEIAARYHPPTAQFAGPYSRAYLVDSVAHPHLIHGLLYLAFGRTVFTNPLETLLSPPADAPHPVEHIGLETLMLPNLAWIMSGDVHCPDATANMLLHKSYPFDATMTAECLPGAESMYAGEAAEHAAWSGPNTVHMTEDFAMGTSCGQFYDGAISDSFHIVYRTGAPAARLADTRAVFCRYLYNDRRPGQPNEYNGRPAGPEMLRDEGRKLALQHRNCAIVAYRPKPYEAKSATSMKLSILFPLHFRDVDDIWLGDAPVGRDGAASVRPAPVFVRDGPVYFCFLPLRLTDLGRTAAVKVERGENYAMISFYNYEGPRRSFAPDEAMLAANGFVAHVKRAADAGDFASFRAYAASGTIGDETTGQLGGYTRRIRYDHPDAALALAFSPGTEGILYATVNGRPRPAPVFRASGFDAAALPFLQQKTTTRSNDRHSQASGFNLLL